jgi:peptide/nickel transport system permease protein
VIGFIIRRIGQAIIVIIGVTVIVFILRHLLPGNIARAILGIRATPPAIAAFNRQNGLDKPLPLQYVAFLNQLIHGNLGFSFKQNMSVDAIVVHDLPNDIVLVGVSLVLALLIAIPLGIVQAVRRNKLTDYTATGIAFVLYSMPAYLLGLLLIAAFAVNLRLLPAEAPQASSIGGVLADPAGLVLPVATLTLVTVALFSRYMRQGAAPERHLVPAPAAQLPDPGRHAGRDLDTGHPDVRADHRAAVQLPRGRARVFQRRRERRLPGGVRHHRACGRGDGARQPDR